MFKRRWSVVARLHLLLGVIVLSGIFGVFGAVQIRLGATLHELNFLHAKYTNGFGDAARDFEDGASNIDDVQKTVVLVRAQPVYALEEEIGCIEEMVMTALNTDFALELCRLDIELADQTLARIQSYRDGTVSRPELSTALKIAAAQFLDNSEHFEPLVGKTVSTVSNTVIGFILVKAIFVVLSGLLLSRSVARDYSHLAETERALAVANEELKELTYRASHDFKSPLIGLKSLARFVAEDVKSGDYAEVNKNVERMAAKVEVLEDLVEGTLNLARADLSEPNLVRTDLDSLIQDITSHLSVFAEAHDVAVHCDPQLAHLSLTTDEVSLRTILENLISNGIKYSSHDRPSHVRVTWDTNEKLSGVRLTVEDNGCGIPEDRQNELFGMFKQFHPGRSDGTGLGMYIVKKNVDKLQGTIQFTSTPLGSSFLVELPDLAPSHPAPHA